MCRGIYSHHSNEISPPTRMRDECFSISPSDKSSDISAFKKISPIVSKALIIIIVLIVIIDKSILYNRFTS